MRNSTFNKTKEKKEDVGIPALLMLVSAIIHMQTWQFTLNPIGVNHD